MIRNFIYKGEKHIQTEGKVTELERQWLEIVCVCVERERELDFYAK